MFTRSEPLSKHRKKIAVTPKDVLNIKLFFKN